MIDQPERSRPVYFYRRLHFRFAGGSFRIYPANSTGMAITVIAAVVLWSVLGAIAFFSGLEGDDLKLAMVVVVVAFLIVFLAGAYSFSVPETESADVGKDDA